ncbi:uncharacterized protein LOC142335509 [Convolutriloba macropyga]|uniref:uncharacterized protein LOC142335509 n=1 Tax=Convolutriloba macropyga TaxID=536237 RepID=UPI003F51EDE3
MTPICKSFNFCHNKLCQINFLGVHEITVSSGDGVWISSISCIYVGMVKTFVPKCEQLGIDVDVKNDTLDPNICQINPKRADCQILEPWRQFLIDTESEWIFYSERKVSESFYGGLDNCEYLKIEEWFLWIAQEMTFEDAKNHCQSIGGQHFGDINGTDEQYRLLLEKQNYQNFWLGISDRDTRDVYMSLNGNDVTSFIRWAGQTSGSPEPSRGPGDDYVCMCKEFSPIPHMTLMSGSKTLLVILFFDSRAL